MSFLKKIFSQAVFSVTIFLSHLSFAQTEPATAQSVSDSVRSMPKSLGEVTGQQVDTIRNLINILMELAVKYSFQVIGGIIVLILGWIIGGYLSGFVLRFLNKHRVDVTVAKFAASAVKLLVMVFALIAALGKFGIDVAPLIAGISVAGLGVSFALQGPLSNYASGITLIFTKPFKVGDIIEVAGVSGEVVDITLAHTDLKSLDGTMFIIPNKHIIGEIIHNCSDVKELDLNIGIGYKTDVTAAIQLMKNLIKEDKRVLREPNLGISSFGESSININARVWCKVSDYWNVMFDLNKQIFETFKQHGIEIPFPQREVRIFKDA